MRVGSGGQWHLGYCTGIFPAEAWRDTFAQLKRHLPALKGRLAPARPFGIVLRLGNRSALELEQPHALGEFADWLAAEDLYVFSIDGAVYGSAEKDALYRPDWTEPARLDYTLRLARLLARLLPEGTQEGSVSTTPLTYKPWFQHSPAALAAVRRSCSEQFARLAVELHRLYQETGKRIQVDLEPEPDCALEGSEETARFFTHWLLPTGGPTAARALGIALSAAHDLLRTYIGVCYDVGHFATAYERPGLVIGRLRGAGVRIGKAQLSNALRVPLPAKPAERGAIVQALTPLAESPRLHQVIARGLNGLYRHADLAAALGGLLQERADEWRIHAHLPLFLSQWEGLPTGQRDLVDALPMLQASADCRHLEIETYTLPSAPGGDLDDLIQREYAWVLDQLASARQAL